MSECVQTALITGAGNGIGRAIALAMADSGRKVSCADINLDDAQRTCLLYTSPRPRDLSTYRMTS